MTTNPSTSSPLIAPFWTRFPRFFVYPLQLSPLLHILLLSLLPAVAVFIVGGGIISGLVSLLCLLVFLRYAAKVLLQTSYGRLRVDHWKESFGHDDHLAYIPFKILIILICCTIPIAVVLYLIGFEAVFIANLLLMLLLPASLMTLIITNSLISSLNPDEIYGVARTIGKPYLLLAICLYCLSSSSGLISVKIEQIILKPYVVLEEKVERLSELMEYDKQYKDQYDAAKKALREAQARLPVRLSIAHFASGFISLYIILMGFNMMGYVLFQYHHPLGLDIDEEHSTHPQKSKDPASLLAQQISELIAKGEVNQALNHAYEAQRLDPFNPALGESYNKLLHLVQDKERLLPHTQKLIPLLLKNNLTENALDAFLRCHEFHKIIQLPPQDLLSLAQTARKRRQAKLVLQLLNGFDRQFPGHPVIPDVYFLCGQVLCEDLHQDKMANQFFTALCEKYPQYQRVPEAKRYQALIARLQSKSQNS